MELPAWVERGRSASEIVLAHPSMLRWALAGAGLCVMGLPLVGWPLLGITGNQVGSALVTACITAGFAFLMLALALGDRCLLCLEGGTILRERRLGRLVRVAPLAGPTALLISCCRVERERGAPILFYGIDLECRDGRVFTLCPPRQRDLDRVRAWVDSVSATTGIPHRA